MMDIRAVLCLVLVGTVLASPAHPSNPHADKNFCPQDANAHFLYADPDDCTKYFACAHGVNYLKTCQANLRFSNVHQVCVYPGSVYDTCNQTTTNSAPTSGSKPTPTVPGSTPVHANPNPHEAKNQCPQGPNATSFLYVDPDDCSKFFTCSNGVNILMDCPNGLHFNDVLKTCVHRGSSEDTCEINQAIKKCREGAASLIPHPHACQRYFNCSNDQSGVMYARYLPFENECVFPNVFDAVTESCMSHKSATCAGISKPSPWECDYKYTWCVKSHCIPCLAPSCVGLSDGFHADPLRPIQYVRCEDDYVVEKLQCPPGRRYWNDALKRCVFYYYY